jgi:hypothetical protein
MQQAWLTRFFVFLGQSWRSVVSAFRTRDVPLFTINVPPNANVTHVRIETLIIEIVSNTNSPDPQVRKVMNNSGPKNRPIPHRASNRVEVSGRQKTVRQCVDELS